MSTGSCGKRAIRGRVRLRTAESAAEPRTWSRFRYGERSEVQCGHRVASTGTFILQCSHAFSAGAAGSGSVLNRSVISLYWRTKRNSTTATIRNAIRLLVNVP